jgi:amino acid transporter
MDPTNDSDYTKNVASVTGNPVDKSPGDIQNIDGVVVDQGLHRALKQRHLQMIALGGVVGYVSVGMIKLQYRRIECI